ncbi:MAG: right-handed parallel beta-helix repeat-containing protein [Bacteroidales bacterium]|nr:right-handed parallel beta-helix repeat-containing protein [Bacteroidales bacterium]
MMRTIRKRMFPILFLCLVHGYGFPQHENCRISFDPATLMINGRGNASMIKPGDTICLLGGNRLYLWFSYLHGTRETPIVIQNIDGQVSVSEWYYGIKIDSCSFIKFAGSGDPAITYGFYLHDIDGAGLSIEGLSTDIEIERVEVNNATLTGIFAKTDPSCSFTSTRDKYMMRNLSVHDNFFHNTGMEGMYIGHTSYTGVTINCNGKDTLVYPHLIRGLKVYNNRIENTAWDGIQISSADSGCFINNNLVLNYADAVYWNQMTGIMNGGGSRCDCFNNIVKDGKGDGIDIFSLGNQHFYNNLIVNAGRSNPDIREKHGFYVGDGSTISGSSFEIFYNTIISPRTDGVKFNNYLSENNLISNNIIIDPGDKYIVITDQSMPVVIENNYFNQGFDEIAFMDYSHGNFDLKPASPAVNTGTNIPDFQLNYDVLLRSRPFAAYNDRGAYECHDSSLLSVPETGSKSFAIISFYPNPAYNQFTIEYFLAQPGDVTLVIRSIMGEEMIKKSTGMQLSGRFSMQVDVSGIVDGLYFCTFETKTITITQKLVVLK